MRKTKTPKLCYSPQRDLDYVCYKRKKIFLGKHGSDEAARKYAQFLVEFTSGQEITLGKQARKVVTISNLLDRFLEVKKDYYIERGGSKGKQLKQFKAAFEYPLQFYASLPVDEFKPLVLQTVRNAMIDSGRLSRGYINTMVKNIRHVFRFGVGQELVKPETLQALQAVEPLKKGRSNVREAPPIKPVDDEVVGKTIEFLPPTLAAMVQLQRLTGMRPGEVCIMRAGDVATGGDLWTYTLSYDKTDYRRALDDKRTIPLGKRAQAVLAPFLLRKQPDEYVFSPLDAQNERGAERREKRTTPITKQTRDRDQKNTRRQYADHYEEAAYARAIARAAKQAGVEHWAPNQLRHTFATEIRAKHGLEAASVLLGHKHADVTQIYAERNRKKAAEIARIEG